MRYTKVKDNIIYCITSCKTTPGLTRFAVITISGNFNHTRIHEEFTNKLKAAVFKFAADPTFGPEVRKTGTFTLEDVSNYLHHGGARRGAFRRYLSESGIEHLEVDIYCSSDSSYHYDTNFLESSTLSNEH